MQSIRFVFVVFVTFFGSMAQAGDFQAYRFLPPELNLPHRADVHQRGDFRKFFRQTIRQADPLIPSLGDEHFTKILFPEQDIEVQLLSEVHELVQDLSDQEASTPPDFGVSCESAMALIENVEDIRCPAFQPSTKNKILAAAWACKKIEEPEFIDRGWDHGDFDPSNPVIASYFESLDGLVRYASIPLDYVVYPENKGFKAYLKSFRPILWKLRYPQIQKELSDFGSQLSEMADVSDSTECLRDSGLKNSIEATLSEMAANEKAIGEIYQKGLAQAQADQENLGPGLCRPQLPYPSLSDADRMQLAMYVGGIYWRIRGGGLWKGDIVNRRGRMNYFHKIPMELIGQLSGIQGVGEAFYDRIFRGWGEWMDMGTVFEEGDREGQKDIYYDLARMSDRGVYQIEPTISLFKSKAYDTKMLRAGGLHLGTCYAQGLRSPLKDLHMGEYRSDIPSWDLHPFLQGFTGWGEFCAGAAMSLAVTKSLLAGHSCH